jgi:hypothetical protein
MLKKLIVTGAAAGLLLVSATAAFAGGHPTMPKMDGVSNYVDSSASTGNVTIFGKVGGSNVYTGDALSSVAVKNIVKGDCGCKLPVVNKVDSSAKSGAIAIMGMGGVDKSNVVSGDAASVVTALNVVITKEEHHKIVR